MSDSPPLTYATLKISHDSESIIDLNIPTIAISRLAVTPRRWLQYIGWAITGVNGHVSRQIAGEPISVEDLTSEEPIAPGEYYYFVLPPDIDLKAVDLHVKLQDMELKSSISSHSHSSQASSSGDYFREMISERDQGFDLMNDNLLGNQACHLIPKIQGDDVLRDIVQRRKNCGDYDEQVEQRMAEFGINSVRNGVLLDSHIHGNLDSRKLAVIKTPNFILQKTDIPPDDRTPANRATGPPEPFAEDVRYTFQWIAEPPLPPDLLLAKGCGITRDAPFSLLAKNRPRKGDASYEETGDIRPSGLLLDYIYGCSALQQWGLAVKETHFYNPRRPKVGLTALDRKPQRPDWAKTRSRTKPTLSNRSNPFTEGYQGGSPNPEYDNIQRKSSSQVAGMSRQQAEEIMAMFFQDPHTQAHAEEEKSREDRLLSWVQTQQVS